MVMIVEQKICHQEFLVAFLLKQMNFEIFQDILELKFCADCLYLIPDFNVSDYTGSEEKWNQNHFILPDWQSSFHF